MVAVAARYLDWGVTIGLRARPAFNSPIIRAMIARGGSGRIPQRACKNWRESVNERDRDSPSPDYTSRWILACAPSPGARLLWRKWVLPKVLTGHATRPATVPPTNQMGQGLAPTRTAATALRELKVRVDAKKAAGDAARAASGHSPS